MPLARLFFIKTKNMSIKMHKVSLRPEIGQNEISETFPMPVGYVVSTVAYTNENEKYLVGLETRKPKIWLELKDNNGADVIPLTPIKHWEQSNGAYKDSFKPLRFQSARENFTLRVVSDRVNTGDNNEDIVVYVYFNYDQNNK